MERSDKKIVFKFDDKLTEICFMQVLLEMFKERIEEEGNTENMEIIENDNQILIHVKGKIDVNDF